MRLRGSAPAGGADLSAVSTEDLMRMRGAPTKEQSVTERAYEAFRAPAEIALTLGTGTIGQLVGGAAGIVRGITSGKYGTPEVGDEMRSRAGQVARDLTYVPRSEVARDTLSTLGAWFDKSKLAGLGPNEVQMLSQLNLGPARTFAEDMASRGAGKVRSTVGGLIGGKADDMAGMGAAVTEDALRRRTVAESLPVPVKLTKGGATRDFAQQRFEAETAKAADIGAPLRQRQSENNVAIIKNLEYLTDETGAVSPSLRATGGAVDDALRSRSEFLKGKYQDAYKRAEAAGEMAQRVDTTPLLQFVSENSSSKRLAPVLQAIEDEVLRLGGGERAAGTGKAANAVFANEMSINDVEKLRKMVVRLGRADETNGYFAAQANAVIDAMTEGKGGALYGQARELFKQHAAEFKNQGALKKLLGTKPGTTDRAVAYEDVFRHSVLAGSRDDTAAILKSLESAGTKGKQAIAELKGETLKYLQAEATKNAALDINGQPIVSYPKLNAAVRDLEIDGKLELLFGKKDAQTIRDIADTVRDLNVTVPGAVNTSTTAAVLQEALTDLLTLHPVRAVAKGGAAFKQALVNRRTAAKVADALADPNAAATVAPTPTQRRGGTVH